jgi:cytochrome P450
MKSELQPRRVRGVLRPPGPAGNWVSKLHQVTRDPFRFLGDTARTYGDLSYIKFGLFDVYLANHPDLIREVLVSQHRSFTKGRALHNAKRLLGEGLLTSEGEVHKRQRRTLQPHFHHERIAAYADVMVQHSARARDRWRPGQEMDMAAEMMRLALSITGKTLFDVDIEGEGQELGKALQGSLEVFNELALPFAGALGKLPLPRNRRFQRTRERVDRLVFRMIDERERDAEKHGDMLSMLVMAQDTEGDGKGMSKPQMRDEAMTILLAGHETTAQAMTWSSYLLSQHPEAEAKLHAEVDSVLGGRPATIGDVPKLRYTRMVMAEAMRLYPPAWVLSRRAVQDVQLGGFVIPAKSLVLVSQWVTHRDPRWWPDPERFDPERFDPARERERPRYAYFPFGGGPRVCIGEPFAWMEGTLVLATLAQRWRLRLAPGQAVEKQPTLTLKPRGGMRMRVEPRAA